MRRLFALLFMMVTIPSFAQFTSNIQGTITDSTGAVVPNAQVTVVNTSTNEKQSRQTNANGFFRLDSIKPSLYSITIHASGFETLTATRDVLTNETADLSLKLSVGKSEISVNVSETVQGLNTEETRTQYTLESKDIDRIPLPDRGTLSAIRLAPGVTGTIEVGSQTNGNVSINTNTPDARANGRPNTGNVFLLDRISITPAEGPGGLTLTPNPDMIQEIALQTTSFSVENGSTSSLQVELTSKSGANKFHGDADYTFTDKNLEATPYYSSGVAPFARRYYLGSLGGPIWKDRAFFFGSFQHTQSNNAAGSQVEGFADPFYTYIRSLPYAGTSQVISSYLQDKYKATRLANPVPGQTGKSLYGPACGQADTLPCDLLVTNTGSLSVNQGLTGTQYNIRLDHAIRPDNDRVYINYLRADEQSGYIDVRPAFDSNTPSTVKYLAGGWVHVLSPNLINQVNAGYSRFSQDFKPNPNVSVFPHMTIFCFQCAQKAAIAEGMPGANPRDFNYFHYIGGSAGNTEELLDTSYLGSADLQHNYGLREYVSWLHGRHNFRFGFQYNRIDYRNDQAANYSRPYNMYFSDVTEWLKGEPDAYSLYTLSATTGKWIGQYYGAKEDQYGVYVQDEWHLRPNVVITAGFRWDDLGNPSQYGDQTSPYADIFLGSGSGLQQQLAGASTRQVSKAFDGSQNTFSPRIGLAWSPFANNRTSVHGGFGLYSDGINLNSITANLPTTTPVRLTVNLYDAAIMNQNFFGFFGGTNTPAWTGKTGVPGLPNPTYIQGTQGASPPYGFPYPNFPINGISPRGLALDPGGNPYNVSVYGVDRHLTPEKAMLWDLGLSQEFPSNLIFGITYSASHSYDGFVTSSAWNSPPGSGGSPVLWTQVGGISYETNGTAGNYNALIASVHQRLGGLNWQASYTWSRSMDTVPFENSHPQGGTTTANPYTYKGFSHISNGDIPQRFTFSGTYETPRFGPNYLTKEITGGWTIGSVIIAQEGTPFLVFGSSDTNNDGQANDLPNVADNITKGSVNNDRYKSGNGHPGCYFGAGNCSASLFTAATTANGQGNETPYSFRNPGYLDVDSNLQKRIELPWLQEQKSTLILRFEALNLLNRTNLGAVDNALGDSQFGQSTTANNPRILQLGARFEF